MKIQIDTKAKTVKLAGSVNLGEFMQEMKLLLVNWEDYTLEANAEIDQWSAPIITHPIASKNPNPYVIKARADQHILNLMLN